jgi:hypothetical protein
MRRLAQARLNALALAAIALACMLGYAPTLKNQFILDDIYIVVNNLPLRSLGNVPSFFVQTPAGAINRDYYRPIMLTSFAIDHALFGLKPAGYHAVNILLHAVCAGLLFWLLRLLVKSTLASFVGALLFAVHPVAGEVVYLVNNRGTALATIGFLLALILHLRPHRAGWLTPCAIGLCYFAAMASKEIGVTLPLALALADLLLTAAERDLASARFDRRVYLACAAAAIGYFGLRAALCHPSGIAYFGQTPAADVARTMLVVEAYASGLLFVPFNLAGSYDSSYLPHPQSWLEPIVLLSAALLALFGLLGFRLRRRVPLLAFGIGLYVLTLLPTLQIVRLPVLFGERFLYLPLVGFAIAVAAGLARLPLAAHSGKLCYAALLAMLGWYGLQDHARAADWSSAEAFWRATVQARPDSVQAHVGLAAALDQAGECRDALPHYAFALERVTVGPGDRPLFTAATSCYAHSGETETARLIVQRWLVSHPDDPAFRALLVRISAPAPTEPARANR